MAEDAVVGALGGAAALGGFVLVFLAIIITAYQSYAGDASQKVLKPYRTAAIWVVASFCFSLASAVLCVIWLVAGGSDTFAHHIYGWTIGVFIAQFVVVLGVAIHVTFHLLLMDAA